jgi:hypothetical protein
MHEVPPGGQATIASGPRATGGTAPDRLIWIDYPRGGAPPRQQTAGKMVRLRLDIEVKDRFGQPVIPREWFLVPLFVVNEAVDRIKDGTITGCIYDPKTASLRPRDEVSGQPATG